MAVARNGRGGVGTIKAWPGRSSTKKRLRKRGWVAEAFRSGVDRAENAIHGLFHGHGSDGGENWYRPVPDSEIKDVLNSKEWDLLYGKKNLEDAWKGFVDCGHIAKKGTMWIWREFQKGEQEKEV